MSIEFHFPAHRDYFADWGFDHEQVKWAIEEAEYLFDGIALVPGSKLVLVREPGRRIGPEMEPVANYPNAESLKLQNEWAANMQFETLMRNAIKTAQDRRAAQSGSRAE
jgi:hypothetical protein